MKKTIFITGATSGFGKAIAEKFASEKWDCIINGRRKERLDELAAALSSTYKINLLPLVFDVRTKEEVLATVENLKDEWRTIDVLVNNAGLAAI